MPEMSDDDWWIDANGVPTERIRAGGSSIVVHYEDIPGEGRHDHRRDSGHDCAAHGHRPRAGSEEAQLREVVRDALDRRLFTVEEALARTAEGDVALRAGAQLLRRLLLRPTS